MKTPVSRFPLVLAGWFVSGAVAFAHPGHDDGHELTWDLGHLSAHPLASVLCVVVLTMAGGIVVGALRRRQRAQRLPVSRR